MLLLQVPPSLSTCTYAKVFIFSCYRWLAHGLYMHVQSPSRPHVIFILSLRLVEWELRNSVLLPLGFKESVLHTAFNWMMYFKLFIIELRWKQKKKLRVNFSHWNLVGLDRNLCDQRDDHAFVVQAIITKLLVVHI